MSSRSQTPEFSRRPVNGSPRGQSRSDDGSYHTQARSQPPQNPLAYQSTPSLSETQHQSQNPTSNRPAMPPQWKQQQSQFSSSLPSRSTPPLRNHLELRVRVRGVPNDWETWDLYSYFRQLGEVSRIDIGERRATRGLATITFRPPPMDRSWIGIPQRIRGVHGRPVQTLRFEDVSNAVFRHKAPAADELFDDRIILPMRGVDFGVMRTPDEMLILQSFDTSPNHTSGSQLVMDLSNNSLNLLFTLVLPTKVGPAELAERQLKLQVNFAQMRLVSLVRTADGCPCFVLTIESPPLAFQKTSNIQATHDSRSTFWDERDTWYRQTVIDISSSAKVYPICLANKESFVDLGRWLTYRLKFDQGIGNTKAFKDFCGALRAFNISITDQQILKFTNSDPQGLWSWLHASRPVSGGSADISFLSEMQELTEESSYLPFAVRYQLEVCLSQGMLHDSNITRTFIQKLAAMDQSQAIKVLEKVADNKKRMWDLDQVMRTQFTVSVVQKRKPAYCARIPSAVVTPTTIFFNTPVCETSNRVIRQYQHVEDRFLRVKFTDERYRGKIWPQDDDRMNEVFSRIKQAMTHGIQIGDRLYEFLAFGNSQFREHGAYFFASDNSIAAEDIRRWMGNFTSIKVIAKYVSRLGQCFTTTRAIPYRLQLERIADVKRNGFCFTDGVGKISALAAEMAARHFTGGGSVQDVASVFQFRLAGCKGVLAVDPSLKGMVINIRPSQEKFPATFHGLEICHISQFSTANLNMQIILVLSALGVPDEVFLTKLKTMLHDLAEAMTNEHKALELLQKNVDFNQSTLLLAGMIFDGFMDTADPFTISCLRLWRSWNLKYLKEKARIFVEQGAFVLGCTDETGILKGHFNSNVDQEQDRPSSESSNLPEIFLQIPDPEASGSYKVVEDICLLARNPSLHPGDVRTVRAVDVPPLRHLKNCVVLPQTGDRDLANMCSGGDLDGDDYLVIWDKDLLPRVQDFPPMDYTAPPPKVSQTGVTVDDMTSFFINHIRNDNLGRIAVAHRYWADKQPDGIKDSKCIELAQLHSKAVDYAKTGVPAEMPKHLRVSAWPHWSNQRNKARSKVYHSNKVLGKLFDEVERRDFDAAWSNPFDNRIINACEVSEQMRQDAAEIKATYDEAVQRIMAQHGIRSEFEVFTTFVLEHNEDIRDYRFAETLGEIVGARKEEHREMCYEKAGTDGKTKDWSRLKPFIVAMYTVTANQVADAFAETQATRIVDEGSVPVQHENFENMPFISFPWIFAWELGQIATKGATTARTDIGPRPVVMTKKKTANKQQPYIKEDLVPEPLVEIQLDDSKIHEEDLLDLFGEDFRRHSSPTAARRRANENSRPTTATAKKSAQVAMQFGSPKREMNPQSSHLLDLELSPRAGNPSAETPVHVDSGAPAPKLGHSDAVQATDLAARICGPHAVISPAREEEGDCESGSENETEQVEVEIDMDDERSSAIHRLAALMNR